MSVIKYKLVHRYTLKHIYCTSIQANIDITVLGRPNI